VSTTLARARTRSHDVDRQCASVIPRPHRTSQFCEYVCVCVCVWCDIENFPSSDRSVVSDSVCGVCVRVTMQQLRVEYTKYKQRPLIQRKSECAQVVARHPDKLPILLTSAPSLDQHGQVGTTRPKIKYLVPTTMTFAQLMVVIRSRFPALPSDIALFMMVHSELPSMMCHIVDFKSYADQDGFLTVTILTENAFGLM
jgi:hypothetical protein